MGVLQLHCCVPLKIPPLGRREQQVPSEEGPSKVETGLSGRAGVENAPVLGGRVSRGRGRERDGSSETRSPIPPLTEFLGNWVPHFPPSPLGARRALRVHGHTVSVSPGRGGSGRGSHPESRCRGRAVGRGAWRDLEGPGPHAK